MYMLILSTIEASIVAPILPSVKTDTVEAHSSCVGLQHLNAVNPQVSVGRIKVSCHPEILDTGVRERRRLGHYLVTR